ncbi:MAG: site-2 protease family protein [Coriobacteriia bacterium]|nr:site-2 protease family protein [Coriobacteriia bacterium]
MSDGFSAIFWGVVTFSLLVVIHEGGHFMAARFFGVKVHEFMVGLPGPAIRFRGKKTTYGITAIPLGGYVRIAGMEPGPEDPQLGAALASVTRHGTANAFTVATELGIDEADADRLLLTLSDWSALEQVKDEEYTYRSTFDASLAQDEGMLLDRARSVTYRALKTWQRIVLLSMGVVLNLLTAVLVFTITLSAFGFDQPTGAIGRVGSESAAALAGIKVGDQITRVGDVQTTDFQSLVAAVATYEPGEQATVVFVRDGDTKTTSVVFGTNPETGNAQLGVSPGFEKVNPSVLEALALSFSYIGLTFVAIAGFFNPQTFTESVSQSSSVIGAAYITADAAKSGPLDYAFIVAVLSLSLGVINIFPLPPLDGGRIALEIIEKLRGRPLPRDLALGISVVGAVLLFALIGYLMFQDVSRLAAG